MPRNVTGGGGGGGGVCVCVCVWGGGGGGGGGMGEMLPACHTCKPSCFYYSY